MAIQDQMGSVEPLSKLQKFGLFMMGQNAEAIDQMRMEAPLRMRLLQSQIAQQQAATRFTDTETAQRDLELKMGLATAAGLNEIGVGAGHSGQWLLGLNSMSGQLQNLMQAREAQAQGNIAAYKLEQAKRPLKDRLKETLDALGSAFGVSGDQLQEADAVNTAMQNGMDAQRGKALSAFTNMFKSIEGQFSQAAGYPISLFGIDDSEAALKKMDELLASNPNLTPQDAFQAVGLEGQQLAQQKFMELTTPVGPNQLRVRAATPGQLSAIQEYISTTAGLGQKGIKEKLAKYGVRTQEDLSKLSFDKADRLIRTVIGGEGPRMGFLEALMASQQAPLGIQDLP